MASDLDRQLREALRDLVEESPPPPPFPSLADSTAAAGRRRPWLLVAAAVVMIIIAAAVWSGRRQRHVPPVTPGVLGPPAVIAVTADHSVVELDESGRRIRTLLAPSAQVNEVAVAPGGRQLFVEKGESAPARPGACGPATGIWRVTAGTQIATRLADGAHPAVSPDGKWLAYVTVQTCQQQTVVVRDATTGQQRTWSATPGVPVDRLAWAPNSTVLAVANGTVVELDTGHGPALLTIGQIPLPPGDTFAGFYGVEGLILGAGPRGLDVSPHAGFGLLLQTRTAVAKAFTQPGGDRVLLLDQQGQLLRWSPGQQDPTPIGARILTAAWVPAPATPPPLAATTTTIVGGLLPTPQPTTVSADLDGDGRADTVTFTASPVDQPFANPQWHVHVVLATGGVLDLDLGPLVFAPPVIGAADIAHDGRQELLLRGVGNDSLPVELLTLAGGTLRLVDGGQALNYSAFGHNCCPYITADLACMLVSGQPSLVQTDSSVAPLGWPAGQAADPALVTQLAQTAPQRLRRTWNRTVYHLVGGQLVVVASSTGTVPFGSAAPPGVPLSNTLSCQGVNANT